MTIIYIIKHRDSDRFYIGQTITSLKSRWTRHLYDARTGSKNYIHCAIRKYGAGAFHVYELTKVCNEDSDRLECFYITLFSSTDRTCGFNTAPGGRRSTMSAEGRKRVSEHHKGNKYAVGAKRTEEHKRIIGELCRKRPGSMLGRKFSPEHCKRIGEASKRRITPEIRERLAALGRANKGTKQSPEAIAKKIASLTGGKRSAETKAKMSTARKAWWTRKAQVA